MFKKISMRIGEQAGHLDVARRQFKIVPRETGAYPERAISHFFIRAITDAIQGTSVLEASFPSATTKKNDNHLDAIVFNDDVAILAEFKTAWAPLHWQQLEKDVHRVRRFAKDISGRFQDGKKRRLGGFYGVDAWRLEIAKTWKTGKAYKKWNLPKEFASTTRGFEVVWRDEKVASKGKDYDDGYYLLFALEELNPD